MVDDDRSDCCLYLSCLSSICYLSMHSRSCGEIFWKLTCTYGELCYALALADSLLAVCLAQLYGSREVFDNDNEIVQRFVQRSGGWRTDSDGSNLWDACC